MINSSIEWAQVEIALSRKASTLTYGADVKKMIGNIQAEITELSRAEVLSRTGHSNLAQEILTKVNNDINLVEEYLLVAALMG